LNSRERLTRGLKYSAVGPVDVTRGTVGLGLISARSSAAWAGHRYQKGRAARQFRKGLAAAQETLANEFGAAQEAVAAIPEAVREASHSKRRPVVIAVAGAAVLAGGAAAFSIIRRSSKRAEPSPRPPSVEVEPKP
jgi:cell wall synthesis protein CwsA